MNTTTINNIIKYSIFGGLFLTLFIPLYVSNNLFFPYITGKGFAFRIIVEIIFALWIVLMLRDKSYIPRFSWPTIILTSFTLVVLIADLLGMNPLRSIWSNFERMEGWLVLVHLWAYFLVLISVFKEKKDWHYFFITSLCVAAIVSIHGIFQLTGHAEIHQGGVRLDASLGNAIYMAVYMLFHFFIACYMAYVHRKKLTWQNWVFSAVAVGVAAYILSLDIAYSGKGVDFQLIIPLILVVAAGAIWRYPTLVLTFAYMLFETATRGTILGLIGGVMLGLVIYAIWGKKDLHSHESEYIRKNKLARALSGGAVILIILLGVLFYANKDAAFIQNNTTLQRLASISWKETQTQARSYIWPMAIEGSLENAKTTLIGSGQENFNYIFNKNYNPKMWAQEQWFDRVHNVYLDWFVASGLLGLLLYLGLFVFAIISIVKSDLKVSEKSIFIGLLFGYAIHNVFVFDNLVSYIFFAIILAYCTFLKQGNHLAAIEKRIHLTNENYVIVRDYAILPVVGIMLLLSLYFVNIRPIQANSSLISSLRACSNPSAFSAKPFAEALSLDQTIANQEIREHLMTCANNVIRSNASTNIKVDFFNLVEKEINEQVADAPFDARAYLFGGMFYDNIGDRAKAQKFLEKAHILSPNKQSISFELAQVYMNIGSTTEAVALMEKTYADAPENPVSKIAYIATLILNGEEKKALELFGNDKNEQGQNIFTDERILGVYVRLKQYPRAIELLKQAIAANPTNRQLYLSLTTAYLEMDNLREAAAQIRIIIEKFPETKAELEPFLKDLQAGKNPLKAVPVEVNAS